MNNLLWQNKPFQAFMNFAIIFSFIVNIILIIVLLLIAPLVLPIVGQIVNPLVGGLSDSFVEMGDASIVQTIQVDDTIPVQFTLPLNQETDVILAEAVPLSVDALVNLGNGNNLNGTVNLELPEGTVLPVVLALDVPVDQQLPVQLDVAVNIPLDKTELGPPFARLEGLFLPLDNLVGGLPEDNSELGERLIADESSDQ